MKNDKKSGIYEIVNKKSGKRYIGQSGNLERRQMDHFRLLENGSHGNIHLQRSYNKHGFAFFEFRIVLYCEVFELGHYEQKIVDSNEANGLYNICLDSVETTLGIKRAHPTQETLKKISQALTGREFSEDHKKKLSVALSGKNNPMYGRKGKDHPLHGRAKEEAPFYGRFHSEETKKKMSEANIGKNNPMYGRRGNDHPLYGTTLSEETKGKISKANSGKNHPNYGKKQPEDIKKMMSKLHSGENNPMFGMGGEKAPGAKLAKKDVQSIFFMFYIDGKSINEIEKLFPVTKTHVSRIVSGKTWKNEFEEFMEEFNN